MKASSTGGVYASTVPGAEASRPSDTRALIPGTMVHVVPPSVDRWTRVVSAAYTIVDDAAAIFGRNAMSVSVQLNPPSTLFHTPFTSLKYTVSGCDGLTARPFNSVEPGSG